MGRPLENRNELDRPTQAGWPEDTELGVLLAAHQDQLVRIIKLRLDRRLQGRLDPTDVVQEAFLEASCRIEQYREDPAVPFFIWLRFLALQKLAQLHRQHLGVQARDAGREISLWHGSLPDVETAALAAHLIGQLTSPSRAAIRAEAKLRLEEALSRMEPIDREVLALRHFEQLSNGETARVLGIQESAACNRHIRALQRLRKLLTPQPGCPGE
jgi:RNA polymerase sigma-70 factor, ECF subfamily